MAIYLTEQDVNDLLTMEETVRVLDEAFRLQGLGKAENSPRRRVRSRNTTLHSLPAVIPDMGVIGLKAYTSGRSGTHFYVLLFDADSSELLAMIEGDKLGRLRTGAASGVASKYLARQDAKTLGVFGAGGQAFEQIEAIACVRRLDQVYVYARNQERLQRFCERTSEALGIPVTPVDDPAAAASCDIVATITTSHKPVFDGNDLKPGAHVNAAGANYWLKQEIDDTTVVRADIITTDDVEQAHLEAGDLLFPITKGKAYWSAVVPLAQIVAGHHRGRENDEQISLFASQGIGLEDVAAGAAVYRLAKEAGRGVPLPASVQP